MCASRSLFSVRGGIDKCVVTVFRMTFLFLYYGPDIKALLASERA